MEAEAAIYPFGSTTFSTFQPPFSIFITAKEISWSNRRLPPLPGLSFVQPFSYDDRLKTFALSKRKEFIRSSASVTVHIFLAIFASIYSSSKQ